MSSFDELIKGLPTHLSTEPSNLRNQGIESKWQTRTFTKRSAMVRKSSLPTGVRFCPRPSSSVKHARILPSVNAVNWTSSTATLGSCRGCWHLLGGTRCYPSSGVRYSTAARRYPSSVGYSTAVRRYPSSVGYSAAVRRYPSSVSYSTAVRRHRQDRWVSFRSKSTISWWFADEQNMSQNTRFLLCSFAFRTADFVFVLTPQLVSQ